MPCGERKEDDAFEKTAVLETLLSRMKESSNHEGHRLKVAYKSIYMYRFSLGAPVLTPECWGTQNWN
jgi:hypothetical protein